VKGLFTSQVKFEDGDMKVRKLKLLPALAALLVGLCVLHVLAYTITGQSSESPRVVAAAAPVYPPIAIAARASSDVIVEVKIAADGNVSTANARSGHPLLQQAAVVAARRWKFEPAGAGARTATLTFTFRINEGKKPAAEITPVFMPPYKVEITGDPSRFVETVNH
jgi:TonB family protein